LADGIRGGKCQGEKEGPRRREGQKKEGSVVGKAQRLLLEGESARKV